MKYKEYMRLAKISLKSRKKTTRSTVRGISFGLILLSPVIFLGLGFGFGINAKLNESPEALFVSVQTAAPRTGFSDYYQAGTENAPPDVVIGTEHAEKLKNLKNAEYVVPYEQITLTQPFMPQGELIPGAQYSVDGGRLQSFGSAQQSNSGITASIFDKETIKDKSFAIPAVDKKFGGFYEDGFDGGFKGDGKGQIAISASILKQMGLEPSSVYGKKFTFRFTDNYRFDNDTNPDNGYGDSNAFSTVNGYLCYEYEVIGIINEKLTDFYKGAAGSPYAADFAFSSASADMPDGTRLEPDFTVIDNDNAGYYGKEYFATYKLDAAAIQTKNREYMFFGANMFSSSDRGSSYTGIRKYPTQNYFIVAKNYDALNKTIAEIADELSFVFPEDAVSNVSNNYASSAYVNFNMLYTIFNYVALVLVSIGGIIFFAAMVNLFNTIMHSVNSRKNYLAVMRAVGARKKVIPNLYIAETMTIFRRAMVWILIFGGLICVGLKIGIDLLFKNLSVPSTMLITIEWWFVPITFLVMAAALVVFGLAFAFGCSAKVASSPITEVLNDEN